MSARDFPHFPPLPQHHLPSPPSNSPSCRTFLPLLSMRGQERHSLLGDRSSRKQDIKRLIKPPRPGASKARSWRDMPRRLPGNTSPVEIHCPHPSHPAHLRNEHSNLDTLRRRLGENLSATSSRLRGGQVV